MREASTDALAGVSTNAGVTNSELPKMARAHLGLDEGSSVRESGGAGIRYVSFQARRGTVERISRFYAELLGATVHVEEHAEVRLQGPPRCLSDRACTLSSLSSERKT